MFSSVLEAEQRLVIHKASRVGIGKVQDDM